MVALTLNGECHAIYASTGVALRSDACQYPSLPQLGRQSSLALRGGLAPWQIRRLRVYVDENLTQPLTIPELAQVARLSASHFCRSFKLSFGRTVHHFVMSRRLEKAQELMLNSTEDLSQIAVLCGMCDQAHLTHWFRRVVGETPGRWRRSRSPR
jgi:AraC family transcriptional regulator